MQNIVDYLSLSELCCDINCNIELSATAPTPDNFLCETKNCPAGFGLHSGVQCDRWTQTKVKPNIITSQSMSVFVLKEVRKYGQNQLISLLGKYAGHQWNYKT